jgi:hypothetical protein
MFGKCLPVCMKLSTEPGSHWFVQYFMHVYWRFVDDLKVCLDRAIVYDELLDIIRLSGPIEGTQVEVRVLA